MTIKNQQRVIMCIVSVLLVAIFYSACIMKWSEEKFPKGSYVQHKMDGKVGMVVTGKQHATPGLQSGWTVRFPIASSKTNTHPIVADGMIGASAYSDVFCGEFEIVSISKEKAKAWSHEQQGKN